MMNVRSLVTSISKSKCTKSLHCQHNFSSSAILDIRNNDENRKRCLLFPGQGAQYVGMANDLYSEFSYIKQLFEECDEKLGYSLSNVMFNGPLNDLTSTMKAQPAVLLHSLSLIKVLQNEYELFTSSADSSHFDIAMGLSLGEYSALTVSQCFNNISDAIYTVDKRARFMQQCCEIDTENEDLHQKMLAIMHDGSVTIDNVQNIINDNINKEEHVADVANYNSPKQIVISGHKCALDIIQNELKKNKIKSKYINTGGAFHSSLMRDAKQKLKEEFKNINVNLPKNNLTVISNVKSTVVNDSMYNDGEIIKNLLCDQVCESVNWYPSLMKAINEFGINEFIEIGPKATLSGMVKVAAQYHNIDDIKITNFDKLEDLKQSITTSK